MNIEQLVPSLELCQRAQGLGYPQGKSYLVYNRLITGKIVVRDSISGDLGRICDAPTLQEVLEELDALNVLATSDYEDICSTKLNSNPVDAALELWCELEERKVSNENN